MFKKWMFISPFQQMSFRMQLMVSFLFVAFFVTILISLSFNWVMEASILKQNEKTLNYSVRQVASNIDVKMRHYELVSKQLSSNVFSEKLRNIMNSDKLQTFLLIRDYVEASLSNERSSIEGISVYEDGYVLLKNNGIVFKYDETLKKEVSKALRINPDNLYWSKTWKDIRGQKVLSLYSRSSNFFSSNECMLELRIYETELFSLFHEESKAYKFYVLNEVGIIMSATDRKIVGKKVADLDEFDRSIIEKAPGGSKFNLQGKQYVANLTKTQHKWTIIAVAEMDVMVKEFQSVYISVLGACLAVIAFAIILTVLFSTRLDKRMSLLNKKIQLLRVGDFDKEIKISGSDEFSTLGLAIDGTRTDLKKFIQEIKETGEQKRKAEMVALRSQINTHFLFNALSTIKWLAVSYDADDIREAIEDLSLFLKISLSRDGDMIPVELEIEHLRAYTYLQMLRYSSEITIDIQVTDEIRKFKSVRLILQPMLENAIYHGRRDDGSLLNIQITAGVDEKHLIFVIEDDGLGMSAEKLEKVKSGKAITNYSGYGVVNVDQRLRMCCGENYGLNIESVEGIGTKITILQPLIAIEEG
jgi:two-component system sensor histidine kinase YesM